MAQVIAGQPNDQPDCLREIIIHYFTFFSCEEEKSNVYIHMRGCNLYTHKNTPVNGNSLKTEKVPQAKLQASMKKQKNV